LLTVVTLRSKPIPALEEIAKTPEHEGRRLWFLGDGIFSMQGEYLDLEGLIGILNRYSNLHAYIDDAHGFSWREKTVLASFLGMAYASRRSSLNQNCQAARIDRLVSFRPDRNKNEHNMRCKRTG
jgi:7-keto-8-aminopelargonate synthetase-like enzyme